MKFLEKKKTGKQRNCLKQSPFSSALFLSEGLDVPTIYWSRNVLSSANVLRSSHCYDCLGTQWNSGGVGGGMLNK